MTQVRLSEIVIPKYLPLINDVQHTHKMLTSGRSGTKSSFMGILVDFLIVSKPYTAAVVLRKHHNKLRKTVYAECTRALRRLKLPRRLFKITVSPIQITYLPNGNTIYFTGSDSIDDTKGLIDENSPIRIVVLDELTEFFDQGDGEDEIQNITATFIRGNDAGDFQMLYLWNPPKNPKAPITQWMNKMAQRDDTIHIHTDYRDVPVEWIGQGLVNEAEAMAKADEKMYRWVWLGEAVGLDDLIYYMFSEEKHVRPAPKVEYGQIYIGVDYGQMNATTFQAYGLNFRDKLVQGLGEYYHSGRDSGKQKSPSEYAQDFKDFAAGIRKTTGSKPITVCIDPSAKGLRKKSNACVRKSGSSQQTTQ